MHYFSRAILSRQAMLFCGTRTGSAISLLFVERNEPFFCDFFNGLNINGV